MRGARDRDEPPVRPRAARLRSATRVRGVFTSSSRRRRSLRGRIVWRVPALALIAVVGLVASVARATSRRSETNAPRRDAVEANRDGDRGPTAATLSRGESREADPAVLDGRGDDPARAILDLLEDDDPRVRRRAIALVGEPGRNDEATIRRLALALGTESDGVRRAVAEALAALGPMGRDVLARAASGSGPPAVRLDAMEALAASDPASVPVSAVLYLVDGTAPSGVERRAAARPARGRR